jgi:ABC-type Fe3+ transport system substrate-binding protein
MVRGMTRRQFVRVLGVTTTGLLAAACAPAAAPQPTAAPKVAEPAAKPTSAPAAAAPAPTTAPAAQTAPASDFQAQWDALVDGAKKEGKLVINTFPGTGYRESIAVFEERYPGIEIDHTTMIARDLATRTLQEQKAGVFSFDVTQIPPGTAMGVMLPAGAWAPMPPAIIHPEVTGDQYWVGGFKRGFVDKTGTYGYHFGWNKFRGIYINTDMVKPGEITSTNDLLDPKWKGKIVLMDPRSGGFTANWVSAARRAHGDEYLTKLFIDQEPVITRDQRQATEMIIRGGMAAATGPDDTLLDDFRGSGVTVNVRSQTLSDATYIQGGSVWLFKNAPHQNAAKLFINWILSKEGQTVWSEKALQANSRRTDVPVFNQESYPTAEEANTLIFFDSEDWNKEAQEVQELSAKILK